MFTGYISLLCIGKSTGSGSRISSSASFVPRLDMQISTFFSFCNRFWVRTSAIIVKVFPKPISSAGRGGGKDRIKQNHSIMGMNSAAFFKPLIRHLKF